MSKISILFSYSSLKRVSLGLGIVVVGIAVWFFNRPNPEAAAIRRQEVCQKWWGISDPALLAKCHKSREEMALALRAAVARRIVAFNNELSAIASGKTRANKPDYPSRSLTDVEKATGGQVGLIIGIIGPINSTTFPAKGQLAKLSGVIVTHEPDPDETDPEPRYFTLETEGVPPDLSDEKDIKKFADRPAVNLDIESLNRYERQFIIDHCQLQTMTPCLAVVLGHIDEIVGRTVKGVTHVGVVVDEVDISPLELKNPSPAKAPSQR